MALVTNERQLGLMPKRYIKNQIRKEKFEINISNFAIWLYLEKTKQKKYLSKKSLKNNRSVFNTGLVQLPR